MTALASLSTHLSQNTKSGNHHPGHPQWLQQICNLVLLITGRRQSQLSHCTYSIQKSRMKQVLPPVSPVAVQSLQTIS